MFPASLLPTIIQTISFADTTFTYKTMIKFAYYKIAWLCSVNNIPLQFTAKYPSKWQNCAMEIFYKIVVRFSFLFCCSAVRSSSFCWINLYAVQSSLVKYHRSVGLLSSSNQGLKYGTSCGAKQNFKIS